MIRLRISPSSWINWNVTFQRLWCMTSSKALLVVTNWSVSNYTGVSWKWNTNILFLFFFLAKDFGEFTWIGDHSYTSACHAPYRLRGQQFWWMDSLVVQSRSGDAQGCYSRHWPLTRIINFWSCAHRSVAVIPRSCSQHCELFRTWKWFDWTFLRRRPLNCSSRCSPASE